MKCNERKEKHESMNLKSTVMYIHYIPWAIGHSELHRCSKNDYVIINIFFTACKMVINTFFEKYNGKSLDYYVLEIMMRIWTKYMWNYSSFSLVTIFFLLHTVIIIITALGSKTVLWPLDQGSWYSYVKFYFSLRQTTRAPH